MATRKRKIDPAQPPIESAPEVAESAPEVAESAPEVAESAPEVAESVAGTVPASRPLEHPRNPTLHERIRAAMNGR